MSTLLIDADGVAFRIASAVQTSIHWDDDIITTHVDLQEAKDAFEAQLERYGHQANTDDVVLCFSCPTRRYFRHDLWPDYKGNRKGSSPLALKPLREWASEKWPTFTRPGLEADDVLGILATNDKLVKGRKIIVSHDKDLQQIPGEHLGATNGLLFNVSPIQGKRMLAYQVLVGDTTDNYPGCPGIGPVKAERILEGADDNYLREVKAAYLMAKQTPDYLATQINVARILTTSTYNFKTKEPILWSM